MLGEEKDYSLMPYRKECCVPDRDFIQFLQPCRRDGTESVMG